MGEGLMPDLVKAMKELRAKYRVMFGFCPECNSDSPEIYDCPVCMGNRRYPPPKELKERWLARWRGRHSD